MTPMITAKCSAIYITTSKNPFANTFPIFLTTFIFLFKTNI